MTVTVPVGTPKGVSTFILNWYCHGVTDPSYGVVPPPVPAITKGRSMSDLSGNVGRVMPLMADFAHHCIHGSGCPAVHSVPHVAHRESLGSCQHRRDREGGFAVAVQLGGHRDRDRIDSGNSCISTARGNDHRPGFVCQGNGSSRDWAAFVFAATVTSMTVFTTSAAPVALTLAPVPDNGSA